MSYIIFTCLTTLVHAAGPVHTGLIATQQKRTEVETANKSAPSSNLADEIANRFKEAKLVASGSEDLIKQVKTLLTYPPYVAFMNEKIKEAAAKISHKEAKSTFHKMNLWDLYQFWMETEPLTITQLAQMLAILEVGGASIFGERRPFICQGTAEYSRSFADGHHNWIGGRGHTLYYKYQSFRHRFRNAGDLPKQFENEAITLHRGEDIMFQARHCMFMYRHSPGHWKRVQNYYALACHDMARLRNEEKEIDKGYKCISQLVGWGPFSSAWQ